MKAMKFWKNGRREKISLSKIFELYLHFGKQIASDGQEDQGDYREHRYIHGQTVSSNIGKQYSKSVYAVRQRIKFGNQNQDSR